VALVLASLLVHATPASVAARVQSRRTAVAATAPVGETLALPTERGGAQLAVGHRERWSAPLASSGIVDPTRSGGALGISDASLVTPRARSHPARHHPRRTSDEPFPH
jgi:hypothetical protein